MDSFLISSMLIILMFVGGGRSASMSKSCSYVNGEEHCTEESGSGNTAMSSSMAGSGPQSYFQNAASIGNTRTGQSSSSQQSSGNIPRQPYPMFIGVPGAIAGTYAGPGMMNPMAFVAGQMGNMGFGNMGFGRR